MVNLIVAPYSSSNFRQVGSEETGVVPGLTNVSETMLWALHNRACEATRSDTVLVDPESVHIRDSIDYDFDESFGEPEGLLAVRAAAIDRTIRNWLHHHPDGCVVSLGEGLETQALRVDNGRMRWLSVDLPDAIRLREQFLPQTDRFRHMAGCALDPAWMEAIDPSLGVLIVAQGLLMYLELEAVRVLVNGIADRFPGAEMVFDVVPQWFSALTMRGLQKTPRYRLPQMPWGINRNEIERTLRRWHPGFAEVKFLDYNMPRGWPLSVAKLVNQLPFVRHEVPSLVHAKLATGGARRSAGSEPTVMCRIPTSVPAASKGDPVSSPDPVPGDVLTLPGLFAVAARNNDRRKEVMIASGQVIAKRIALGVTAVMNPASVDHEEFAQVIPEKVEAFSHANMIVLDYSAQAAHQIGHLASKEIVAAGRAAMAMISLSSPMGFAQAQRDFAGAWFERAYASLLAVGMLALDAQDAASAPIRVTVMANAKRLDR